jgi:hypothetical protein
MIYMVRRDVVALLIEFVYSRYRSVIRASKVKGICQNFHDKMVQIYEYKTAKKVDNTVQPDLSKLKGRSVVVTGGT